MKKLIVLIFTGLSSLVFAQADKDIAASSVDKNTIKSHIYFLADDLLQGRGTGTPGNKIAASYLANSLRRYGAKPAPGYQDYYQPFELIEITASKNISLTIDGEEYPMILPLKISEINSTGEAIFLNYGEEKDFKGADVSGKLVILKAGSADAETPQQAFGKLLEKRQRALDKGALGVVEVVRDMEKSLFNAIKHSAGKKTKFASELEEDESDDPYLWISVDNESANFESGRTYSYNLKASAKKIEKIKTQNVIGIIEGTDPVLKNEYIIYSGHYDHVGVGEPDATGDSIYNGARDNAIGTTAVLTMAETLGKKPTKRSALFIFFTAEEKGLLGSKYYVEHPVIPLEDVVYCFNTDGGGYNDTSLATIIGLERTTAKKHLRNGASAFGLKPIEDPAVEQGLFDRSDNVSFAKKGIPAPTYSTGFHSFDDEIFKYYHQPGDEAESLDYDYLLKFYKGYVYAGRLIANDPERPFWIQGDKYEEAGKKLYNMGEPVKD